jgi:hypothetical protein
LLLQIPRRILRVGSTNSGADDRSGGRPDARAPSTANRGTNRRAETGA